MSALDPDRYLAPDGNLKPEAVASLTWPELRQLRTVMQARADEANAGHAVTEAAIAVLDQEGDG